MTVDSGNLSDEIDAPFWKFWQRRRCIVVILAFFGFFNAYTLRVNLSIAIVAMTENRTLFNDFGEIIGYAQDFDWSSKQQGLVLSSFFYGYIMTQVIGGMVATKFGGNYVFGIGIGATAILTIFTPMAAKTNFYVLIAIRIIEGIFEGVTYPSIHAVWSKWSPPHERSRMATIAFAGSYAGTVFAMPISGILANNLGWESVFYVFGSIGCIWVALWLFMIKESPEKDLLITENEKNYIVDSLKQKDGHTEVKRIPWIAVAKSPAIWAIIASQFSENWGFYTLLTQLPTFLQDTMDFKLQKTGFYSALPYLAMGSLMGVAGFLADWFQIKGYLTTTQVRKYFNCGAFLSQTFFMIIGAYILHPTGTIICFTIAVGLGAFAMCGFAVNHLDIAPQFAGTLMGFTNTFGTIPGIVSPLITGFIVQNKSKMEWQTIFYITAGIYSVGCIIYWCFASGEVQHWAIVKNSDVEQNKKTEENLKIPAYSNSVAVKEK